MEFDVNGLTCQHCVQRVTRAALALDASARADAAQGYGVRLLPPG